MTKDFIKKKTMQFLFNEIEKLRLGHKLWFFIWDVFAIRCPGPCIFQTINSIGSNNQSLKNQKLTPLGCKDIGIRKFEFVAKTPFLSKMLNHESLLILIVIKLASMEA